MRNRGFTLIELLVAIGIIATLAGLLLPVLKNGRQSAQLSQCTNNMEQIGAATLRATQDNNGYMIGWYNYSTNLYWWQVLLPYVSAAGTENRIFQCPADTHFDPNNMAETVSYGWNYLVLGRSDADVSPMNLLRVPNFIMPTSTLMITDSAEPQSWGYIDPYGHHPDPTRHSGNTSALFLDGHVETLTTAVVSTTDPYLDRSKVTQ